MSYILMGPSTQRIRVPWMHGSPNDSDAGAIVDAPAGSNGSTLDQIIEGRSAFSLHYTNIRGFCSNFSSVEYHLASFSPSLLLSKTKLTGNASTDTFNI